MKLKQATQEEYLLDGGLKCPYCDSEAIEGTEVHIEAGYAYQDMMCDECGRGWTDTYRLTGYAE